jgi:hypothetical protein
LAWLPLLLLLLLLPMAQLAAAWHGLSHGGRVAQVGGQSVPAPGDPLSRAGGCDLCLTAAGLHGGALPGVAVAPIRLGARHEAPRAAPAAGRPVPLVPAYRSHAPPIFLASVR